MRLAILTLGGLLALLVIAPGAHAAPATPAAECPTEYAPPLPTTSLIDVKWKIPVGRDLKIKLDANANTDEKANGTFELTIRAKSKSQKLPSIKETYDFSGTPIDVTVGSPSKGTYIADVTFTPDDACAYTGSDATASYEVVDTQDGAAAARSVQSDAEASSAATQDNVAATSDASANTETATQDDIAAASMPNTGGPSQWWLLMGLTLVAGGAGAITFSRRRAAAS